MKKQAFTLIELLVTVVLFSLLLATSLYSFRFISLNIRNINNINPKTAIYYDLLRDTIGSISFYVETDEKERDIRKKSYYFFKGSPTECFFISNSSFYYNNITLGHLIFKDNTLWYEEGRIFRKNVNYMNLNSLLLEKKIIILKNLKNVSFSYVKGNNEYFELKRKIPSLINLKIEDAFKTRIYSFSIKGDNDKHLEKIRKGKELL